MVLSVYVAEGSSAVRERLVAMIDHIPFAATAGNGGDAAVAVRDILAGQPDVAVISMDLHGGSGMGVLREIAGGVPVTRLILLSEYSTAELRQQCRAVGVADLFDKSMDIERLLARLEGLAIAKEQSGGGPGRGDDADAASGTSGGGQLLRTTVALVRISPKDAFRRSAPFADAAKTFATEPGYYVFLHGDSVRRPGMRRLLDCFGPFDRSPVAELLLASAVYFGSALAAANL